MTLFLVLHIGIVCLRRTEIEKHSRFFLVSVLDSSVLRISLNTSDMTGLMASSGWKIFRLFLARFGASGCIPVSYSKERKEGITENCPTDANDVFEVR